MFRPRETPRPPDALPLAVVAFLASLVVFLLLTPHILSRLNPPTGDEPFYLMTARSLLYNHSLDETAVWANQEYLSFYPPDPHPASYEGWPGYPNPLPPHVSKTLRPGLYSKHGVGLATLIIPAYALGDRAGVIFFVNIIGALVAANVFLLVYESTAKRWVGFFAWGALTFTSPLMSYSFLLFPEIEAALFTVYAFRRCLAPRNGPWHALTAGLAVAALPWLNARFIPVCAVLIAFYAVRHLWAERPGLNKRHLFFFVPVVLSALGLMYYYYYLYGTILPNYQDHAGESGLAGTLVGILGLPFDQQWGLLVYAPVFLLAVVGGAVMWRRRRTDLLWILAVWIPYYLEVANYRQWWGEWCPPARYLVVIVPLLALPLGWAMAAIEGRLFRWLGALSALISVGIMAAFMYDPQFMFNQPTGDANVMVALGDWLGTNISTWLPSFVVAKPEINWAWTAVWVAAMTALVMIGFLAWLQQPFRQKLD
jgi:hypothetical protein